MTLFFFLIALAALCFSIGAVFARRKPVLRVLLIVNIAAVVTGAVLTAVSLILAAGAADTPDVSPDRLSWAADAFSLWLRSAGIVSAVAGGTFLLASLIRHKMKRIRAIAGCALVWLLLLLGEAYASTCVGTVLDPSPWIRLCTAGLALSVTAWSIPDLAYRLKENPKISAKKRNIRR